jgi:hypothetical protein
MKATCTAILFSIHAAAALAAEDGIVTDRPDFVESSLTVGKYRFQFETSVNLERDDSDGVKSRAWTTPTLLRFGVLDDLELRLESDGYTRLRVEDPAGTATERGWQDLDAGLKWHMRDQDGALPSVGWLLHATLDTGSAPFRGDGVRPSLRASMEWDLGDGWALGMMPGVAWDKDAAGDRYTAGIFGIVLGYGLTERSRVFAEVAATQIAADEHGGNVVTFDVGGAYLLTDMVQLDTAVFIGATDDTPDLGWTLGLSMKF